MAKYTWQPYIQGVYKTFIFGNVRCLTPASDADVDVTVLSVLENTHG